MRKINLVIIMNYILGFYLATWIYYAILNWDVFSVKLNTNAGFSTISGYPFVFFFLLGFMALLTTKYFVLLNKRKIDKTESNNFHRISMLEKDIELLKMKEVLFKMQTSEMGRNSSHLNALHEKLDKLSEKISNTDVSLLDQITENQDEVENDKNKDKP